MASSTLPEPGTKYGPCPSQRGGSGVVLNCAHKDCAEMRLVAASVCLICGQAIGYGADYYRDPDTDGAVGVDRRWLHALCLELKIERERKAARG